MDEQFSRTAMLIGDQGLERLKNARVALFGVGGVGSFAAEALVRAGIGAIDLFDSDIVCPSNLNRQLIALHSTLGCYKVDAARERLLDINPDVRIEARRLFYLPETAESVDLSVYDYIVDCVDTVAAKIELAVRANSLGIPMIASMGTGNKLNPAAFEVEDLSRTTVCPLARVMRRELRKRGIHHMKVVYSREEPRSASDETPVGSRRSTPGSVSFCPSVAGLILAGEVVRDLADVH